MISTFIPLYSFTTIFIKTNSPWLIIESIKALEITSSILLNFDFANTTILSCFFLLFLITDIYLLIPAVIAQIFNPIAELIITIGIPIKEAKAEIETYPATAEAKIRKCSIWFRLPKPFCAFYSLIHFALFLQENDFFFDLYFLM